MPPRFGPVELPDGSVVSIRAVRPSDRDDIARGVAHLSDESRRRRFFTAHPALGEGALEYLSHPDQQDHVAIGAECEVDGQVVGVAIGRYARLRGEPDAAELAITVLDEHQGRGIGTLLLRTLESIAREAGIRRFVAYVLWENTAMVSMMVAAGGRARPAEPGVARIDVDLGAG